jgi:hypothetical protein
MPNSYSRLDLKAFPKRLMAQSRSRLLMLSLWPSSKHSLWIEELFISNVRPTFITEEQVTL